MTVVSCGYCPWRSDRDAHRWEGPIDALLNHVRHQHRHIAFEPNRTVA